MNKIITLVYLLLFSSLFAAIPHPIVIPVDHPNNEFISSEFIDFRAWLNDDVNEVISLAGNSIFNEENQTIIVQVGDFSEWQIQDVISISFIFKGIEVISPLEIPLTTDPYENYSSHYTIPIAAISGVVLDDLNNPLESSYISILESNQHILTNEFGHYEFETIPSGEITISCEKEAFETESVTLNISSGANVIQNFQLEPTITPPSLIFNAPNQISFTEDQTIVVDFSNFITSTRPYSLEAVDQDTIQIIINENQVTFTSPENWYGTEDVRFIADNGQSREVIVRTIPIIVEAENDPPILLQSFPDLVRLEDFVDPIIIDLTEYFSDLDTENLNYGLSYNTDQVNAGIIDDVLTITSVKDYYGIANISVSANDNDGFSRLNSRTLIADDFNIDIISVNEPPEITQIVNQIINEDNNLENLSFVISDEETQLSSILLTASSSDEEILSNIVLSGNDSLRFISLYPNENKYGSVTITITADDLEDLGTMSFDLEILPINDPPVFTAPDRVRGFEDQTIIYDFSHYISDVDDTEFVIDNEETTNLVIAYENLIATITPRENWNGSELVTFMVSDQHERAIVSDEILFDIDPVDDPPIVSDEFSPLVVEEDFQNQVYYNLLNHFTELDGEELSFVLDLTDQIVEVERLGNEINIFAKENLFGNSNLIVTAIDESGNSVKDTLEIIVNSVNDLPTISQIPNQTTLEDQPVLDISFIVTDVESENSTLDVTAISINENIFPADSLIILANDENRTISLYPLLDAFGTTEIQITVSDNEDSQTTSFFCTVIDQNDPPKFENLNDINIDEDTISEIYNFSLIDVDNDFSDLTYGFSSLNPVLIPNENIIITGDNENKTIQVSPLENANGNATIRFNATDGISSVVYDINIIVNPINDKPIISSIDSQIIDEDNPTNPLNFTIFDVETNPEDLTISVISDNVELFSTFDISGFGQNKTLIATPTLNKFGEANITVIVNDESLADSTSFIVTVNPINDPPEINLPESFTIDEDIITTFDFSTYLNDVDSDNLILSMNSNLHITANIANSSVEFVPTLDWFGSTDLTFSINDQYGRSITSDVTTIIVNPINDVPVLTIPDTLVIADDHPETFDFSSYIYDPDNDGISITFSGNNEISFVVDEQAVTLSQTNVGWLGTETITCNVSDGVSLPVTQNFVVEVKEYYAKVSGVCTNNNTLELIENVLIQIENTNYQATSQADGFYEILGIEPGTYRIYSTIDEYFETSHVINLGYGEDLDLDFSIVKSATLTGVIREGLYSNERTSMRQSIRDLNELLEGVEINILETETSYTTTSSGSYLFKQLDEGIYTITFEKENYQPITRENVSLNYGFTETLNIYLTPISSTITGNVIDFDNNIADAANIRILGSTVNGNAFSTSTISDENGDYILSNIPKGIYSLTVSKAGFNTLSRNVVVEINSEYVEDFQLDQSPGNIYGSVEGNNASIQNANIALKQNGLTIHQATTNVSGTYTINGITPGHYDLEVSHPYFYSYSEDAYFVNSNTNQEKDVVLTNIPSTLIINSEPEEAVVWLNYVNTGELTNATFDNLTAGFYGIQLVKDGYQNYITSVFLNPGETLTLDAALNSLRGSVGGTITSNLGGPLDNVSITIVGEEELIDYSNSIGVYEVRNVPIGTKTVLAEKDGYYSLEQDVIISQNNTSALDFELIKIPEVDFTADNTIGIKPLTVNFSSSIAGVINSYLWDFGDGNTSTLENPNHTYNIVGEYDVSLTVVDDFSEYTTTKTKFIQATPFDWDETETHFYVFLDQVIYAGNPITENDWIGIFNGSECVGASRWNGVGTGIPAYGVDPEHPDYCEENDQLSFKIWISSDEFYDLTATPLVFWHNNTFIENVELSGGRIARNIELDLGVNLVSFVDLNTTVLVRDFFSNYNFSSITITNNEFTANFEDGSWNGENFLLNSSDIYTIICNEELQIEYESFYENLTHEQELSLVEFYSYDLNYSIDILTSISNSKKNNIEAIYSNSKSLINVNGDFIGDLKYFEPNNVYKIIFAEPDYFELIKAEKINIDHEMNPTGFVNNVSSNKMLIHLNDNRSFSENDWIIALKDNFMIGATKVSENDYFTLNGCDEWMQYLPRKDEKIQFKLWKSDIGTLINLATNEITWESNSIKDFEKIEVVETVNSTISNYRVFPNPFYLTNYRVTTQIQFELSKESRIEISVYDVKGRKVQTILDKKMNAGLHNINWGILNKNNKKISSGIYFVNIKTRSQNITKKLIIMK